MQEGIKHKLEARLGSTAIKRTLDSSDGCLLDESSFIDLVNVSVANDMPSAHKVWFQDFTGEWPELLWSQSLEDGKKKSPLDIACETKDFPMLVAEELDTV